MRPDQTTTWLPRAILHYKTKSETKDQKLRLKTHETEGRSISVIGGRFSRVIG